MNSIIACLCRLRLQRLIGFKLELRRLEEERKTLSQDLQYVLVHLYSNNMIVLDSFPGLPPSHTCTEK